MFVVEWYRRFYFREIRAFIVRRTNLRLIWGLVHGGIFLAFAAIAAAFAWSGSKVAAPESPVFLYIMAWLFGSVAVICLVLLVCNLVLGPACRCYVLTPAGWQALAAPARLGSALEAQSRIIPLIAAAQGGVPESETASPSPAAAPYQGTS